MGILSDFISPFIQGAGMVADYRQQQQQFKYDQKLQQTMFDREDNAVQRRADDLKAAGLSQTLAAGGAAQTMSPVRAQVPGAGIGNQVAEAMALRSTLLRQQAEISKTKADEERIKLEYAPMQSLKDRYDKGEMSVDPYSGIMLKNSRGVSPIDYLGNVLLSNAHENNLMTVNNAMKSSYEQLAAQAKASQAMTELEQVKHDFDLTKSFGVRSNDKIDAVWEAVIKDMGLSKEGAPYASAAKQVIGKLFNAIIGLR